jgi:hypothetical protein
MVNVCRLCIAFSPSRLHSPASSHWQQALRSRSVEASSTGLRRLDERLTSTELVCSTLADADQFGHLLAFRERSVEYGFMLKLGILSVRATASLNEHEFDPQDHSLPAWSRNSAITGPVGQR